MFGIDLRKWAAEGAFSHFRSPSLSGLSSPDYTAEKGKVPIPPVVTGILEGLTVAYTKLASDEGESNSNAASLFLTGFYFIERRKTWIYEVPLASIHHLREQINALPLDSAIPPDLVSKYDAPVLASTLKLWALELDPPLGLWEGWDDIRKIYPSVGADASKDRDNAEELKNALIRLPKVHLAVLDTIILHLKK
jgi:hypothetical protein